MKRGATGALAHIVGRVMNSAAGLENPNVPITPEQLIGVLGGGPTYAGPHVNERSSMRSTAVYACVALVSGLVAGLPLQIYKGTHNDRVLENDHPYAKFFRTVANPEMALSSFNWLEMNVVHMMLWGNHYSLIDETKGGDLLGFVPFTPDQTTPLIHRVGQGFARNYRTRLLDGTTYDLPGRNVLHFCGLGFDGLRGLSVIQHMARQAIGANLAMEEAAARMLATGARLSGVVSADKGVKLSPGARDQVKAEFRELYQGSYNAGEVAFLDQGMTWVQAQMSARDAELLESRKFSVVDIARGFGVPPFFIGESGDMTAWGSGLEQVMLVFLMTGLDRWLKRIEAEINLKLFAGTDYFCEFQREALQAMNVQAMFDSITKMLMAGATLNEVRERMKLSRLTLPGADEPMVSNNVLPLSRVIAGEQPKPKEGMGA